jgi:alkanesulfonate monooxygenase SsuD/methylene tetrahydromethanopterin reductase-like flavin-dependent oxidoreductase (luciferase family)
MDIAIGLPGAVPGATGAQLTDWARAADEAGFSSLGTIDRIAYPNYDPIVALSAAAGVTERIRLATTVMLGPLRANAALVAKQALSVDALAGGGRMVLGIAVGAREDDYEVSGFPMSKRGAWMDSALEQIRHVWNGEGEQEAKVGPRPVGGGPSLILGGSADVAFERAARHGDGWIMGGGSPDDFVAGLEKLTAAWEKQGREGQPRKMALCYYSLGDDAEIKAESYLRDYYAWLGEEVSGMIAGSAAKDAETVQGYISAFESAACDELVFFPSSSDPQQVGLLAEAAGL